MQNKGNGVQPRSQDPVGKTYWGEEWKTLGDPGACKDESMGEKVWDDGMGLGSVRNRLD